MGQYSTQNALLRSLVITELSMPEKGERCLHVILGYCQLTLGYGD